VELVLVTAANHKFYDAIFLQLKDIKRYLPHLNVIIYDLGFTSDQLIKIKNYCNKCTIKQFNFKLYSSKLPHVSELQNYAWKPIIIQVFFFQYSNKNL
jgi:hypothetical protein